MIDGSEKERLFVVKGGLIFKQFCQKKKTGKSNENKLV